MASNGNFAVFSIPTRPRSPYSSSDQITGGGLSIKGPSSGSFEPCIATISPNSGKWYWEYRAGQGGGSSYGRPAIAVSEQGVVKDEDFIGGGSGQTGVLFTVNNGKKRINGSDTSYGNTVSQHDIVQVALDCDNGAVYFGINNTWQNSGDPESGSSKTGAALSSGIQNVGIDIIHTRYVGGGIDQYNFGQDDTFGGAITAAGNADGNGRGVFKYAPPSGYLALCSANLPISDDIDPAQTNNDYPAKQFGVVTYTGTGSSNALTGLGFQPDLVWIKERGATGDHKLTDSSRGVTKSLESNEGTVEATDTNGLTAFGSDGFTVGSDAAYNNSSDTYVAWCWKAGGGTTTSFTASGDRLAGTYQANTKSKFSIITYTGNATADAEVLHGLGTTPNFIIYKARSNTHWWGVYLKSGGTVHTGYDSLLYLNSSNAIASPQAVNIAPDSTKIVFSGNEQLNTNAATYVMYAWADVDGMQKFGTYVGNGNADGPFIYTGFRPAMYFVKNLTAANGWFVYDKLRDGFNDQNDTLSWQDNSVEDNTYEHDIYSNGFKPRDSNNATNQSGQTFIYGAWADVPFKYGNTFPG
jgi:hypothetical protein